VLTAKPWLVPFILNLKSSLVQKLVSLPIKAVPFTVNIEFGFVVPIPTLPPITASLAVPAVVVPIATPQLVLVG